MTNPTDIEKTYNKLLKAIEKANRAMKEFRESVQGLCHHPERLQYYYDDDRDNGYGRWWKQKMKICSLCGKSFYQSINEWREVQR
jgi:hypothetical protein